MDVVLTALYVLIVQAVLHPGTQATAIFVIVAPHTVRFNTDTTLIVSVSDVSDVSGPTTLSLELTDDDRTIWTKKLHFTQAKDIQNVTFNLELGDVNAQSSLLDLLATDGVTYVKESLMLDRASGYLFIQTDKPIYTPQQTVMYRVVALDEDMRWATWQVRIDIVSPEGIVLDRMMYSARDAFSGKRFQLPVEASLGKWKIQASFVTYTKHHPKVNKTESKDNEVFYIGPEESKFNSSVHTVTLQKVFVFTREWLELYLTVSFDYLLRKRDIDHLYDKYGLNYEQPIRANAIDAIKKIAVQFSIAEYAGKWELIESEMHKALWNRLSGTTCHYNCSVHKYACQQGCKPICSCSSDDNGFYIDIIGFNLIKVPIPTLVLKKFGISRMKRPVIQKPKSDDKSSYITKITIGKIVTSTFEVKEYELPTFSASVEVSTRVVLKTTRNITVKVLAKYLHQKGITGNVAMRLGVLRTSDVALFPKVYYKEIRYGNADIVVNISDLQTSSLWFPRTNSKLYIEANVTDESSMETQTIRNQSAVFAVKEYKFTSLQNIQFIPGREYHFQTKLLYANDDPAAGIEVKVEVFGDRRQTPLKVYRILTSAQGDVDFNLPDEFVHGSFIHFKVTKEDDVFSKQVSVNLQVNRVEEARLSGWVLSLKVVSSKSSDMLVEVRYSTQMRERHRVYLHILVEAKGKIVYTTSRLMRHHGTHNVRIPAHLAPALSPSAYVTAFYIAPGSLKIVADYIQLDVPDQCFQELQVLHASLDQRAIHNIKTPGSETDIRLRGAPGMVVGLLAVDKAVYVINNKKSLSRETLFSKLGSHNLGVGQKNSLNNSKYMDVFKKAGYVLLTNMEALRRESKPLNLKPIVSSKCKFGPCQPVARKKSTVEASRGIFNSVHWDVVKPKGKKNNVETIPLPPPRKYFPESWMFQEELFSNKTNTIRVKLPDSITTWVIEAIGVSSNQGVCVSKPLNMITFKPFFVNVWLPYKVVRLEKVNIRFSVFNYQPRDLSVKVNITADEEICITDKKFGKKWLQFQTRIAPDTTKGNDFTVIPLKSGHYKLTIVVRGDKHVDVIEKKLYVVAEGKPVKKTLSFPLDPTGRQLHNKDASQDMVVMNGSTIRTVWNLKKKEQKTLVDLALPAELIPGTDRCDIFAYGDLMADVIFTMLSSHVDLMSSSISDAEEVLGNLAPVIHAIKYIKLTNRKTPDVEEKGHDFVRNGVVRLLKYRKSDGSFSLLKDAPSSTWFTAVVLKTLCQARDVAHVDDEMLNKGFLWLLDHLSDNGTMQETNPTYDYDSEDMVPNMEAEVLIALMECGFTELPDHLNLQGPLLFYLEDHFDGIVDVLVLAKVAYALYLTESPNLPDVLHMLTNVKKVTAEGLVYWSDQENMEEDMSKPHWYQEGPDEQTIEATSYALLVFLKQTVTEVDVDPIAEWLIRQRGTYGAFVGALDTTVATQSLAAYVLSRSMKDFKSDLQCNISTEHSSKYHRKIKFSHKNVIVRKSLSDVPTGEHYRFTSSGSGLGEVQIEASYNIPVGKNDRCRYNVTAKSEPIKLSLNERIQSRHDPLCDYCGFGCGAVTNTHNNNNNFNGRTHSAFSSATICVEVCLYRKVDMKISRGVTVEVGMLSGYIPLDISTEQMSAMTKNRVKSHQYDKLKEILVAHFHTVPLNETTCFGFLAKDQNVVFRHRPATVTLTEQGRKDASCSSSYDSGGSDVSLPVLCTQPSQYRSRECVCTAGTCGTCAKSKQHKLKFLKKKVCSSDYVYQIQYREFEKVGQWKQIAAEVLSVNKSGYNRVVPGQDIILNVPKYCRCPAFDIQQPHYLIGRDAPRTKDIEGIDLFRFVVDDSTFFGLVHSPRDKRNKKNRKHYGKRRSYSIRESHLRFAIRKDRKHRCPK